MKKNINFNIVLFLLIANIVFLFGCNFSEENNFLIAPRVWWDYDWTTKKKLLIDNSGQSEDLANFPVLIHLNSSNIDYTKTQDNGEDIRFVDNNWNQLSHEIEQWDESGSSFIWVNVPLIHGSSAANSIYMYYNNPTVADNQNSSGVWDSSYETVLHLNQTTGTQFDSTANNNNGTPEGTVTSLTAGQIGNSCDFDAGTDRIVINANISATVTISAWAKLNTQDNMLWCVNATEDGPDLWFKDGNIYFNTWNGFANPFGTQPVNIDQWHYYSTVIKNGDTQLFVDGVSNSSAGYEDPTSTIIYIGSFLSTYTWDGSVDEFRVSNMRQSDDWIKAQYLSMSLTNGFISYGAEEEKR